MTHAEPNNDILRQAQIRRAYGALGRAVAHTGVDYTGLPAPLRDETGAGRLAGLLEERRLGVLRRRSIPGTRSVLDLIAVGPGGATVIDVLALQGAVRAERRGGLVTPRSDRLLIGGSDRTDLVVSLERKIDSVQAALQTAGLLHFPVEGAICVPSAADLPGLGGVAIGPVLIASGVAVARVAGRSGPVARNEAGRALTRLECCFPPLGEAHEAPRA